MPCAEAGALALAAILAAGTPPVHGQRYSMGTMFDIVVYHPAREEAERAVAAALDEVVRLDGVMSHYRAESELSRALRDARDGAVQVSADLFAVLADSLAMARHTDGRFDITIGPLVAVWRAAAADGRRPAAPEIAAARACVGADKIVLDPPDRLRVHSPCLQIDLGGIGKGYAVDRALEVLRAAGIEHAIVNAGGSSIAAIGAPPGRDAGWPVRIGRGERGRTVLLRDASLSTSEPAGETIDPLTSAPVPAGDGVTVRALSATLADALSTALVLLPADARRQVLDRFAGVSLIEAGDAR